MATVYMIVHHLAESFPLYFETEGVDFHCGLCGNTFETDAAPVHAHFPNCPWRQAREKDGRLLPGEIVRNLAESDPLWLTEIEGYKCSLCHGTFESATVSAEDHSVLCPWRHAVELVTASGAAADREKPAENDSRKRFH